MKSYLRGGSWLLSLAMTMMIMACAGTGAGPTGSLDSRALEVDRQAEQAYRAGQYGQAMVLYEELVELMPDNSGYWYQLGNSYVRADREREAVLAYERSLVLDGDNPRVWHNLGVILLRKSQEAFLRGAASARQGTLEHELNQRQLDLLLSLPEVSAGIPADGSSGEEQQEPRTEEG